MENRDFEKLMARWAKLAIDSAPEMHPTPEMIRLLQAQREQARPRQTVFSRRLVLGTALGGLLTLLLISSLLLSLAPAGVSPSVAVANMRTGVNGEKGGEIEKSEGTPVAGARGGNTILTTIQLELYRPQANQFQVIDLEAGGPHRATIGPADDYRLLIEPAGERHLIVFQLSGATGVIQLFPNQELSSLSNPLPAGAPLTLPAEPNWLFLPAGGEPVRLIIVATERPPVALATWYARYLQADSQSTQQAALVQLRRELDTLLLHPPADTAGWSVTLDPR